MSTTVDNSFVTLYTSEVKHAYQAMGGGLRQLVRSQSLSGADTAVFHRIGTGAMNTKGRHADVTPMDVPHNTVSVTVSDHYAPEYIDDLDAIKTNISLRSEYVKTAAYAGKRKEDELITDAWNDGANASTAAGISAGATISTSNMLDIFTYLGENHVAPQDTFLVIGWEQYNALLKDSEFENRDYNQRAVLNGARQLMFNWGGLDVLVYDNLPAGTSGSRLCYAGDKRATGFAINADYNVRVDYVAEKAAWLVLGKLSMGGVVIDKDASFTGIVEIDFA